MFQKIDTYFFKEALVLTFIITSGLTTMIMCTRLTSYSELIMSSPNLFSTVIMIFLYVIPKSIYNLLPVAALIACSTVTIRMSLDGEYAALLTTGVSVLRFMRASMILGLFCCMCSLCNFLFFEPYTTSQFAKFRWIEARSIIETLISNKLTEKSFINDNKTNMGSRFSLYFDSINSKKEDFKNIFISFYDKDDEYSNSLISKDGSLKKSSEYGVQDFIFSLNNGVSYVQNTLQSSSINISKTDWTVTYFTQMNLSMTSVFNEKFKDDNTDINMQPLYPKQYYLKIKNMLNQDPFWSKNSRILSEIENIFTRFCFSFASLIFPIVGTSIGILDPRQNKKGAYLWISLSIAILFACLSLSRYMVLNLYMSPLIILIITPMGISVFTLLILFWRIKSPPSMGFFEFIKSLKIKKTNH